MNGHVMIHMSQSGLGRWVIMIPYDLHSNVRTGSPLIWGWPGRNDNHNINSNTYIPCHICFFTYYFGALTSYMPDTV